jgi:hypothetical protein
MSMTRWLGSGVLVLAMAQQADMATGFSYLMMLLLLLLLQVGADLTSTYWQPGNGSMFLDLVQQLTGKALAADAWVAKLQLPTDQLLAKQEQDYQVAVKAGPR